MVSPGNVEYLLSLHSGPCQWDFLLDAMAVYKLLKQDEQY